MTTREKVATSFNKHGGNISAVSRELGIARSTVHYHLGKMGGVKKPVAGGTLEGVTPTSLKLPRPGQVKRYILTSAQNNTHLNEAVWQNLLALADHYSAELLVGTYSYNRNAYGELSVKRGTKARDDRELWFDPRLKPYIKDVRLELGKGLVWCGEMNVQPTAVDPLSGLETYSGRKSAIFPHAKHALQSIAALPDEGVKFNYTTGTVTQKNYIAKKAGLTAEHHHSYGGVIVEVDDRGHWWVRQLDADESGTIQDLTVRASEGRIVAGYHVEAITWGDIHATTLDPVVTNLALGKGGMMEVLRPCYQFVHDLIEGVSINHHGAKDPHDQFKRYMRGFLAVDAELRRTAEVLNAYQRRGCQTVVVDSNHDNWISKWLKEHDYRRDPQNAMLFLEAQLATYTALHRRQSRFNITEWAMRRFECPAQVKFLMTDESFKTCNDKIENGMHGHLGPNGARGTPANLNKIGRRANTGHTHTAQIINGLYVAGTSTTLSMGYNRGPSSWSHSHILTYPNGKRAIVTMYAGKWRA